MKITNKKIAAKKSSVAWLTRQAHDPYVERAHREGYRARAVYKLIEINEKFRFLRDGQVVVDLGAAPGSWSQYIAREFPKSHVIAMDLLPIKPIPGVEFYTGDFTTDTALDWLNNAIAGRGQNSPPVEPICPQGGVVLQDIKKDHPGATRHPSTGGELSAHRVDVVLSDMAPNTTGHQKTDHLRQAALIEYAWDFAKQTLKPGGTFVAKSFTGGTTDELLREIKRHFNSVHHIKPAASRKDSVEMFIVGLGFREE
ncbi:MAG: RlmE family RNA methyltransferase [Proteobacteria bacterium]|nr:RlmE family RNA methyltransferase [Pseudomonadota bacterium]